MVVCKFNSTKNHILSHLSVEVILWTQVPNSHILVLELQISIAELKLGSILCLVVKILYHGGAKIQL